MDDFQKIFNFCGFNSEQVFSPFHWINCPAIFPWLFSISLDSYQFISRFWPPNKTCVISYLRFKFRSISAVFTGKLERLFFFTKFWYFLLFGWHKSCVFSGIDENGIHKWRGLTYMKNKMKRKRSTDCAIKAISIRNNYQITFPRFPEYTLNNSGFLRKCS